MFPTWVNMTKIEKRRIIDDGYSLHFGLVKQGYRGDILLDIPEKYRSWANFRTTFGHKANHMFEGENASFGTVLHPSFGDIGSVVADRKIKKGDEVFVNYNYGYNEDTVPTWYKEQFKRTYGNISLADGQLLHALLHLAFGDKNKY